VVRFDATTLWHFDAAEWRRPQHHFRQIETLPALAACLLCPESGQTGRRLTKSALCQKQTRAPEQSLSFEHLVGAQHKLGW